METSSLNTRDLIEQLLEDLSPNKPFRYLGFTFTSIERVEELSNALLKYIEFCKNDNQDKV